MTWTRAPCKEGSGRQRQVGEGVVVGEAGSEKGGGGVGEGGGGGRGGATVQSMAPLPTPCLQLLGRGFGTVCGSTLQWEGGASGAEVCLGGRRRGEGAGSACCSCVGRTYAVEARDCLRRGSRGSKRGGGGGGAGVGLPPPPSPLVTRITLGARPGAPPVWLFYIISKSAFLYCRSLL